MDTFLIEYMKEDIKQRELDFYKSCELVSIRCRQFPAKTIGFDKYFELCDAIEALQRKIKEMYKEEVKSIYTFQSLINGDDRYKEIQPSISMHEYIGCFHQDKLSYHNLYNGSQFFYMVIEFNEEAIRGGAVEFSKANLKKIYSSFSVSSSVYCSLDEKEISSYHVHYNSLPAGLDLNKRPIKRFEKVEVDERVKEPLDQLTVSEFHNYVTSSLSLIFNDLPYHSSKFLLQDERQYKYLREEYVPLMVYTRSRNYSDSDFIKLGKEIEPWDAKLLCGDSTEIVEITQAYPQFEYETRKALAFSIHGVKGMSLKLRKKHQQALDYYPRSIVEAIEAKHKKEYKEPRVLLISVLLEFLQDDEDLLQLTLDYLKKATSLGNFKAMYLILDGKRCVKVH